jgi:hypothetical protein
VNAEVGIDDQESRRVPRLRGGHLEPAGKTGEAERLWNVLRSRVDPLYETPTKIGSVLFKAAHMLSE